MHTVVVATTSRRTTRHWLLSRTVWGHLIPLWAWEVEVPGLDVREHDGGVLVVEGREATQAVGADTHTQNEGK